jgi:Recombination endonuclease VII
MTSRNERRRQRYAEDPEYRERVLAGKRVSDEKSREETNARRRQKWAKDPELRAKSRLAAYGLTKEGYDRMLAQQHGACAICKRQPQETLCIDHDHDTGQVRGLLCRKCNLGLGFFDDSPSLLRAAAAYLEAWRKTAGTRPSEIEAEPAQAPASCRHDERGSPESGAAAADLQRCPCVPRPWRAGHGDRRASFRSACPSVPSPRRAGRGTGASIIGPISEPDARPDAWRMPRAAHAGSPPRAV